MKRRGFGTVTLLLFNVLVYPLNFHSSLSSIRLSARVVSCIPMLFSRHESQLEAPNRMEGLLISNQISAYCTQINKFAGSSFEKLFLAGSLQKEA